MLIKTHIAITAFFILVLMASVEHKLAFILIAFFVTFLPDVDSRFSTIGRKKGFRILQFFIKHRGILHSLIFLFLITGFFILFLPIVALPFFLGYFLHLFSDSFTIGGIKLFYPFGKTFSGRIRTGGKAENLIFISFFMVDIIILFAKILSVF